MAYRLGFLVIALCNFGLAALYAVNTPLWQVPDEPAHFNYVRTIAQRAALPVLQAGDYDHAYLEEIKSRKFPPELSIDSIRYESHQPPVYYLLAAVVYKTGEAAPLQARLIGLRLFSTLAGAVLLATVFRTARDIFPGDRLLPIVATGLVAFVPQHVAMQAAVNNDGLAEVVLAGIVLALARIVGLGRGDRGQGVVRERGLWWAVGVLTGLGFLTKTTTYVSLGLIAVTLYLRWRGQSAGKSSLKRLWSPLAYPLSLALIIGGVWLARNALTYGPADWLGLTRHSQVVTGQPRTLDLFSDYLTAATYFFPILFRSFWGQFGWMGVVLDARIYDVLLVFSAAAVLGGVMFVGGARLAPDQRDRLLLLLAWFGFTLAATIAYSLEFFQAQGRYLFPALGAIGIFLALGVREWLSRATAVGERFGIGSALGQRALLSALLGGLAALDWICLYRYIIPALALK